MQRVLSFPPQSNRRFGDPSEFVSKRMCFSFMFSITFLAVLAGFLLGRFVFDQELELSKAKLRKANQQIVASRPPVQQNVTALIAAVSAADFPRGERLSPESAARSVLSALEEAQFDAISPLVESRVNLSFPDGENQVLVLDGESVRLRCNDTRGRFAGTGGHRAGAAVAGNVFYVNFGRDEDYHYLDAFGLSVRESVVVARVGRAAAVDVVTNAIEHEAVGVVLFRDPQQKDVPEELLPPGDLARLGSFLGGDGAVPVVCISAADAERLFREMSTSESSPESWRGDLNSTYPMGPGFASPERRLLLRVNTATVVNRYHDVFGAIRGGQEPDRFVLVAHERRLEGEEGSDDSTAIVTAVIRALGELRRTKGWRPHRSVVIASWGMPGQSHARGDAWWAEVKRKTVAYLKVDSARTGNESVVSRGAPALEKAFAEAAAAAALPRPALDPMLQTGADAKLVENGIPFIELQPPDGGGVDRVREVASFWAVLAWRLAERSGLPFGLDSYVAFFNRSVAYIEERFRIMGQRQSLFLDSFFDATQKLVAAISSFQSRWSAADRSRYIDTRVMNDQLLRFSHVLSCNRDRSGFEESFRHIIFSRGTWDGDPSAGFGVLQDLLRATSSTDAPYDLQQQMVRHLADLVECIDAARVALADGLDAFVRPQ